MQNEAQKERIRRFADAFITDTREDGETFVRMRDEEQDEFLHIVRKAHMDRLPDDRIWAAAADFSETLVEALDDNPEADIDEVRLEWAAGYADVYTRDLLSWLAEHASNIHYLDDAVAHGGSPSANLINAQIRFYDNIARYVLDYL